MVLAALLGLGYLGFIAWSEGWRVWVVVGMILLVGLIAGVLHGLFARTRR